MTAQFLWSCDAGGKQASLMTLALGLQVVLRVEMMCGGCEAAVKRVLNKMEGAPILCTSPRCSKPANLRFVHLCFAWRPFNGAVSRVFSPDATRSVHFRAIVARLTPSQGARSAACHSTCRGAGVESYDVELAEKKVTVRGNVTPEQCVEKLSKTGKQTSLWA